MMKLAKTCMQLGEIKLLAAAVNTEWDRHILYMANMAMLLARIVRKDRFHRDNTSNIASN